MSVALEIGKHWLTAKESTRVAKIAALRQLFGGDHRSYFLRKGRTQHVFKAVGPNTSNVLMLIDNLPGNCTLKHADLLFGEPVLIEPENDSPAVAEAVQRIDETSKLHAMLYETAATAGWAGRAFIQTVVTGGRVRLVKLAPENVHPRYAPGGDDLVGATLKLPVRIDKTDYVRVIDHSIGRIKQRLYEVNRGGRVVRQADIALLGAGVVESVATGIDELTIVEVPNYTTGGRGASDYHGGETLIDEINNRLTQISRILDQHGDPAMVALEELFDEKGNLKISGRAIAAKTLDKGEPVRYLTWDAKLADCAMQLDRAVRGFLRHMEVAPELVGWGGGTSADSWKKFKLSISPTLARVNRKIVFLSPALKAAFRVAMKLENVHTPGISYPVEPISLTYSDGLPDDNEELMRVVSGYRAAGVMSRRRALMWIHNDPQIVDEEMEALAAEDEASLPTAFQGGGMAQAGYE